MQESLKIVIITMAAAIALNWFIDYKIMQFVQLLNFQKTISQPIIATEPAAAEVLGNPVVLKEAFTQEITDDQQTILNVAKRLAHDYQVVTLGDEVPKYDFSKLDFGLPLSMQMDSQPKYGSLGSPAYTSYQEIA